MTNELSIYDAESGARFEWNGAHTVNVYNGLDQNVDCYSIGSFADDAATLEEFEESVPEYLNARDDD